MLSLLLLLVRIGRVGRVFRRRAVAFRKYRVAPRRGERFVQRRLLQRLWGRDAPLAGELETATDG